MVGIKDHIFNDRPVFIFTSSSTNKQIPAGLIFSVKEVFFELISPVGKYSTKAPGRRGYFRLSGPLYLSIFSSI